MLIERTDNGYRIGQYILEETDFDTQCCEIHGIEPQGDIDYFQDAEVISVRHAPVVNLTKEVHEYDHKLFIDFITSKGVLTFVCYNRHNGYYTHRFEVRMEDDTILEEVL